MYRMRRRYLPPTRKRVKMISIYDVSGSLVINYKSREWCKIPYPGHSKGCPNYGMSKNCPPIVPRVEECFDLQKPHYFVVSTFDLGSHIKKMKSLHPNWSDSQARCVLYWQNGVRKNLKESVYNNFGKDVFFTLLPEAMGVNVFSTLDKLGIKFERKPQETVTKVALVGEKI